MKRALVRLHRRDAIGVITAAALLPLMGSRSTIRTARSEVASADAEAVVSDLAVQIWQQLDRPDLNDQQRIDALATLLESKTDVDLLSRLVLGRYWNQLSDEQRTRYRALFRDVVMRNFARRLNLYANDSRGQLEDHFTIISSAPAGKQDALVRSRVRPQSGETLAVDWRLRQGDDGPVIIDLIIEGVSLLVSQRSEFAAVIERSDMEGLLAELQARASPTKS
ncbi:MAG: MlaC/ttg2D family ABC transporter substrate-binding protein [Geminicoccaceae bacterium]